MDTPFNLYDHHLYLEPNFQTFQIEASFKFILIVGLGVHRLDFSIEKLSSLRDFMVILGRLF